MNKKSTQYYHTAYGDRCSYCHADLMPYDIFDEYGGYNGSYFKCSCEVGIIEQKMNDEIEVLENQIQEIKNKYHLSLEIDFDKINKEKYELELERLKEQYGIDQPDEENDIEEDIEILNLVKERDQNDDGTRYTTEEIVDMRKYIR